MPKGKSESVNRRRSDNTMAKRKGTNDKNKEKAAKYTHKTKDRVKTGVNSCALEG